MGQPLCPHMGRITEVANALALEDDLATTGPRNPGNAIQQFRLAIARHPGDADDLALAHREGHIIDAGNVFAVAPRHMPHLKHNLAGLGLGFFHPQQNPPPHHGFGQFFH